MPGCHTATVTRCDSRANFGPCPCFGYSAQGSLSTPAPTAATVQQQGSPFGACPCRAYRGSAADYFT